jgi:hypothetical protein
MRACPLCTITPMIAALLAFALLQGAPSERIAGLLELPEIYGGNPCEVYTAGSVSIHSKPANDSPIIGMIEVAKPWRLSADGGCETIEVRVRRTSSNEKLPALEVGYEVSAAIVYEQAGMWLRIKLESGSGWVRARDPAQFHSYVDLLKDSLTSINKEWDGRFWASPAAGSPSRIPAAWLAYTNNSVTAAVIETRLVRGQLWLRLRLDPEFGCNQYPSTLPKVDGWLPAYRPSGQESVWFSSRGC